MEETSVPVLFELAACTVSRHLDQFTREIFSGLPVTVLSALVEYLSAHHLNEYEDIFLKNGITVSRAWIAHLMKRWTPRYQNRPPIFSSRQPPNHKHNYLQKHFQDCLKAFLTQSVFDPSTPFRQPLRNEPAFVVKPMVHSHLKKDIECYAEFAKRLVTRCSHCDLISSQTNLLKTLRKSTKVLETFLPPHDSNPVKAIDQFMKLMKDLKHNGCLEEVQVHVFGTKSDESLIRIIRECAGQNASSARMNVKSKLPFVLGLGSICQQTTARPGCCGSSSSEDDLYDEALSTLASRKSEKEFEQLLAATEKRNLTDENSDDLLVGVECSSKTEECAEGKQLKGFACYGVHCCGEMARELAYALMSWNEIERLAIHYFGGAGSSLLVSEENDPDFALLCQVLLHKVREHQLTQLVLVEHVVQPGPLRAVVKFYTALISALNLHYRISANQGRPLEFLRLPIVCALEETVLFGGKWISQPVKAVEELKFELDPAYTQNRDTSAQHMAAFITSFIQFDQALTHLSIKDSAAYMFRATDQDVITICSALAENRRITFFELDINLSTRVAVEAIVDVIGRNQSLTNVRLLRVSVDWEDSEVKVLQERLISVVKDHKSLTALTLKGRLGRALNGSFLVDFVVALFQGADLPKLKHLNISETGITTDDLFRMASELKLSPCANRFPALEILSVRNTVKSPRVSLKMLSRVKQELKTLAFNVEITFEEMLGFQAEMMAMV